MRLPKQTHPIMRGMVFSAFGEKRGAAAQEKNLKDIVSCQKNVCSDINDLHASVACDDFCGCVHGTDNSFFHCLLNYIEDVSIKIPGVDRTPSFRFPSRTMLVR